MAVTRSRVPGWLPPGDRGYRAALLAWLDATPGAQVRKTGRMTWAGSVPSGTARLSTGPVHYARLLDAMQGITRQARGCRRIEAASPGWLATVTPDGAWQARGKPPGGGAAQAGDEAGLLRAITAAGGIPGGGWWDALEAADELNREHGAGTVRAVPLDSGGFGLSVPLGDPRVALPADAARRWLAADDAPAGEAVPDASPAGPGASGSLTGQ